MDGLTEKIRAAAVRLLSGGQVDVVLGYRAGTVPLMSAPYFVRTVEEAGLLIWDSNCRINLANFLPRRTDRVAVTAKGCDARNIVNHIVENQIPRERVYILGVPCSGMIEPEAVQARAGGRIDRAIEADGRIEVKGPKVDLSLSREEVLRRNCAVCVHRNPPVYDELLGEAVPEQAEVKRYEDIEGLLNLGDTERWAYFNDLIKDCIRCYACRDACPLCYCHVCFVDETMPQWLGKSNDRTDTLTYHLLRAFHCAGRCTDCGACEAACSLNIKVRQFTRLLERDVFGRYGYEAGLALDKTPPLTVYRPDDPQEFIK